jgi:hypothetical protein
MPLKRPYLQWFDTTLDIPIQTQSDDPANLRSNPVATANARSILGGDGNVYTIGDLAVGPRGSKNIIWSSEGYTSLGNTLTAMPGGGVGTGAATPNAQAYNGVAIPALTAAQKKATGTTGSATLGNIGTLLGATPPPLDFSPYRQIVAIFNLISFTGGASPSIQFEIDFLDDAATPLVITPFKPAAALTAATTTMVVIGPQQPFIQSVTTAAITSISATGFPPITAVPAGLTSYYAVPMELLPQGQIQWTVANAPTAASWTCFLYGKY